MSYYDNATLMALNLGPWRRTDSRHIPYRRRPWLGVPLFTRKLRRTGLFSLRDRTPHPAAADPQSRHR